MEKLEKNLWNLLFIFVFFISHHIAFGNESHKNQNFEKEDNVRLPGLSHLKRRLVDNLMKGNLEDVQAEIDGLENKNTLLNLNDSRGDTFLHWVARNRGSEDILYTPSFDYSKDVSSYFIRMLLSQRNKDGLTPQELAELLQNAEMLSALSHLETNTPPIINHDFQHFLQAVENENLEEYRRIFKEIVPKTFPVQKIILKISEISYTEDEDGNNIFHHFASVKNLKEEFNKELLSLMVVIILNYTHNLNQALTRRNKEGEDSLELALKMDNLETFKIFLKGHVFYKNMKKVKSSLKSKNVRAKDIKKLVKQMFPEDNPNSSNETFIEDMEKRAVSQDKTTVLQMFQDLADEDKDTIVEILKLRNNQGDTVLHFVAEASSSPYMFMNLVQQFQQKARLSAVYNYFLFVKNNKGNTPIEANKLKVLSCRYSFTPKYNKQGQRTQKPNRRRVERHRN